jgi:hypothetical protein
MLIFIIKKYQNLLFYKKLPFDNLSILWSYFRRKIYVEIK